MTIRDAISKVDALKPNTYKEEDKVRWLSTLDTRVKTQIIDAHECSDPVFFYGPAGKTFGQMSREDKAKVSHRGNALRAFAEKLKDYLK